MSKKSRIISILAIILCLGLSGFIGYRGGYVIGLYNGFNTAYVDAMNSLTPAPRVEQSADIVSIDNSIARRQANQNDVILPLDASAFEPGNYDFELSELGWRTEYDNFRSFFESLGIIVIEESELAGWFKCQLPEGWSISYDDAPNRSRDEAVYYLMPDGTEAFHIISHKNMTDCVMSITPNRNLSTN